MTDTARLEREASEAEAKAASARAKIDDARAAARAAEMQRAREYDERIVTEHDDAALETQERAALDRFAQAVIGDEVLAAWIEFRTWRLQRQERAGEANSAAVRLGRPAPFQLPGSGRESFVDALAEIVSREMRVRAGDESDARHAAREDYIAGGSSS